MNKYLSKYLYFQLAVRSVKISLEKKLALFEYDANKVSIATLCEMIESLGFDAQDLNETCESHALNGTEKASKDLSKGSESNIENNEVLHSIFVKFYIQS